VRLHFCSSAAVTLSLLLCTLPVFASQPLAFDLDGRPVTKLAGPGTKIVVLVFAATDCPISNRYVPEVARLNREFSAQGVHIWWVFPNPEDTASAVAKHNHDYSITVPALLDTHQTLVQEAHTKITPEAAVFEVEGNGLREVYRGRIDDRYIAFGQERPHAEHHELETAIAAALAGKDVPPPAGPPVGCSIVPLTQ
jgi:AhpC/TSA family